MNMVEKILARASGRKVVEPGDVVVAQVDLMVMHDLSSNFVMKVLETEMENASIQDPSRIAFVFDHNFSPPPSLPPRRSPRCVGSPRATASAMSSTPGLAACITVLSKAACGRPVR